MADVQTIMEGVLYGRIQNIIESGGRSLSVVVLQSPLPSNFLSLTALEELDIGRVETHFEGELNKIGELNALQSLQLGEGTLSAMPMMRQLGRLEHLIICNNRIKKIPKWMGGLQALETIALIQNDITSISASLCSLTNLRVLRLDNNLITEVPDSIGGLINLENLSLDHNHVATLSPAVTSLSNLKRLSLLGNRLTFLPVELSLCQEALPAKQGCGHNVLPRLTRIDLRDNPLPGGLAVDTSTEAQVRALASQVDACFSSRLAKSASED